MGSGINVPPKDCDTNLGRAEEKKLSGKRRRHFSEVHAKVCLDRADLVIDGMTTLWNACARVTSGGLAVEGADGHGDLGGVVDDVFDGALEESFVGIVAAGDDFREVGEGKFADAIFELVAALIPAGEKVGPGDGRLGPIFFGFPFGHGIGIGGEANAFVPEEKVLKNGGDGIGFWSE